MFIFILFLILKNLLWLDINCSYAHSSLALPAIHAQENGKSPVEWDVVTATNSTNTGAVVEAVFDKKPDILCATAWLFTHEYLLKVITRVKALLPECVVILGGPEFLGDNERYLREHPETACVFRGEGETEFHKWLEVYADKNKWGAIKGLCFIDGNGKYCDGGIAKAEGFESLNYPESSRFFRWDKPFVQLETTRGCFNSCSFCVSGAEKPVRQIPIDKIRQRIADIYGHGIRKVRLLDRTFNGNPTRAKEMLALFTEFPGMRFHLEIHPALLGESLRKALRELPAGMLHLEAGIQSLNESVLNACGRKGGLTESLDGLRFLCGLENTETHADLIAGLPLYTLKNIYADITTLAEYRAAEIQLELLKVLPGTEMRRAAAEKGIKYSPLPPYEVLETPHISVPELQTARLLSRLLDMYYNARAWHKISIKLITEEPVFLPGFLAWTRAGDYLDQPLSVEKRGLLLYKYISANHPDMAGHVMDAWKKAGLSLRKIEAAT